MSFAENLAQLMKAQSISQADLARKTKLSSAQIAYLVNGKTTDPKLSTMVKLAEALDCTIADLAGEAAQPTKKRHGKGASYSAVASPDKATVPTPLEHAFGERAQAPSHQSQPSQYPAARKSAEALGQRRTGSDAIHDLVTSVPTYENRPVSDIERTLANSLKDLMRTHDFDQITATQICKGAGVSRRSFYRHFLDKYDLLTWTFYQDLCVAIVHHDDWVSWDYVPVMCEYFERDREFYRHAYTVEGRNSFREFATQRMYAITRHDFENMGVPDRDLDTFIVHSIDFVYDRIRDWILSDPHDEPRVFADNLRHEVAILLRRLAETAERPTRNR